MRTHNICLYKKVNKKYTGCNKTMEFHECALIGVCAVIRLNTVRKMSISGKTSLVGQVDFDHLLVRGQVI